MAPGGNILVCQRFYTTTSVFPIHKIINSFSRKLKFENILTVIETDHHILKLLSAHLFKVIF